MFDIASPSPTTPAGPRLPDGARAVNIDAVLAGQHITTEFQPIISMGEQKIIGVEALSRGLDPATGKIIPPAVLFRQAHRCGRLLDLDRLCLRMAIANFSRLFQSAPRLMLWLNVDPRGLDKGQCADTLIRQMSTQGIDPERVVIEIIESQVSKDSRLLDLIRAYRRAGFLIAIDDWGTAYSNMARIQQIRPDIIKIHRSLACRTSREIRRKELVRAMLNLARGIGALVVVEGVETEEAAFIAMDLGAPIMQGFFFCRPTRCRETMEKACADKFKALSARYKSHRIKLFEARRQYFRKLDAIMEESGQRFCRQPRSEFDQILESIIAVHPELECAYVLDDNGIQFTHTACSARPFRRNAFLFHAPFKGSDRSTGNFFLLLQSGATRFVSEPHTSLATGNPCVTVSQVVERTDGRPVVICADCDCHNETLAVAQSRR